MLEELGIDSRKVYDNFIKGYRPEYLKFSWHFWYCYIWPTYSKMLENIIDFLQHTEYRYKIQGGFGTYGSLYRKNKNILENITGLSWDQIKEKL